MRKHVTKIIVRLKHKGVLQILPVAPRFAMPLALCVAAGLGFWLSLNTVSTTLPAPTPVTESWDARLPEVLSADDKELYREIFQRQSAKDFDGANQRIAKLSNKILMGHVLADRYLSDGYRTDFMEAQMWLERYSDHPETDRIYSLASRRKPSSESLPAQKKSARSLKGYGTAAYETDRPAQWRLGLNAWRQGKKKDAAEYFAIAVRKSDDDKPGDVSAAAYWAYRAYNAIGDNAQAKKYLEIAARTPRTFYGILATKALKRDLALELEPDGLSRDAMESLGTLPAVRRAIALVEAGQPERAEKELRRVFPSVDNEQKHHLLILATLLDLPALQMRMALALADETRTYDFAIYPIPSWQPREGFGIDPALLFAMARQESGFHTEAKSHAGALGLMQIMPTTAKYVARNMRESTTDAALATSNWKGLVSLKEPETSLSIGQSYLHTLMQQKHIGRNLFFLSAAYNAGPGKLAEWQRTLNYGNDPLLFLESIPYAETRRYVADIMTGYWIYSEIITGHPVQLSALRQDHWPHYEADATQVFAESDTAVR